MNDESLLTVPEAAAQLSVSVRKVWELVAGRTLPSIRIGRAVRIKPCDLATFVDANRSAAGPL